MARVVSGRPLIPAEAGIQGWVHAFAATSSRGFGLALLGIVTLMLAGCGRNGPLESPPGPAIPTPSVSSSQLTQPDGTPIPGSPQDTAAKTGFDAEGRPVATSGSRGSFILDPLLR